MRSSVSSSTPTVAVSLPVITDFHGVVSRGVTVSMSLESLSFETACPATEGSPLTVQFCLAKDFAYLKLSGHVISVTKEDRFPQVHFRISAAFLPMTDSESAVLGSCLQELERYLDCLESASDRSLDTSPSGPPQRSDSLLEGNPRRIMSLYVTDSLSVPQYRRKIFADASPPTEAGGPNFNGTVDRRANTVPKAFQPRFEWRHVLQGLVVAMQFGRDLLVRLLPNTLSRLLVPKISFAFIVHPRNLNDVYRKVPLAYLLPPRLVKFWLTHQWPVVGSYITGLRKPDGEPTTGAMLFSPLTGEQMIQNLRLARTRVYQTVQLAEKMGARIAGLGGFTSIVTNDGLALTRKVTAGITTGNAHSAGIAVQNVLLAAALTNLSLPHSTAAIVGGAGSLGTACAKILYPLVAKLILIDIKKDGVAKLIHELNGHPGHAEAASSIKSICQADVVIAATNSPYYIISPDLLNPGSIIIDAAQPKNVSHRIPAERKDVLVIESAIVQAPDVNCNFDLGLGSHEAFGCLSETMLLTAMGWQGHYSVGKAHPQQATEMAEMGRTLGLRLAYLRNSSRYLSEEDLVRVAKARTSSAADA